MTIGPGALIDRSHDALAAVLAMCERGHDALLQAASVVEAREILAGISTLEHAVKVRDMNPGRFLLSPRVPHVPRMEWALDGHTQNRATRALAGASMACGGWGGTA